MTTTLRLRPANNTLKLKIAAAVATPELTAAVTAAQAAQTAAELAESNAETAETNAETAETNAAASASAASTSATNASNSASAASTSASNAATSATNASNSASAASTSASNAATSETNASNSEIAAAASAAEAAAAADNFDDVYLGSKASDPTLDNDGNALVEGQIYWNNVSNALKIYDGAAWQSYSAASGLTAVVDDTAPTLGGNLDTNGFTVAGRNVATDGTKLDGIEALADVTDAGNVGSAIHDATGKTTPIDADELALIDSAASNALKKVTWANVKSTLNSIYQALHANLTAISGLTTAADKISYWTGPGTAALADLPSYGRTVISQTSEANLKAAINAEAGVDFMAYDAQLSSVMTPTAKSTSTLGLTDAGKLITPASSGQTISLPANASVAMPLGTVITFFADANSMTIAINSDTLIWSPSGATGSRTLASGGTATAVKYASTFWFISGVGLT